MVRLAIDYESYSTADLKKVGASRYSRHPSTEIMLMGFSFDDDEPEIIDFASGDKMLREVRQALRSPEVIKTAWNAGFEMAMTQNTMGEEVYYPEWRDTMVLGYTLSFPGKLEKAAVAAGFPEDKKKDARGKALIRKFCGPKKKGTKKEPWLRCTPETNPEEWEEFKEYCKQDVRVECEFWKKFREFDLPKKEWQNWFMDQEINNAGIPINMDVVRNAIKVYEDIFEQRIVSLKKITGLENPNSNAQFLSWVKDAGYKYDDLKAAHVRRAVEKLSEVEERTAQEEQLLSVLEMRQEISQTSIKKYYALRDAVDSDNVLRNAFQFAGAQRTWRWAGRKFQPQNLKKPPKYLEDSQEKVVSDLEWMNARQLQMTYEKPMDVLSMCVRPVAQAIPGHEFADADLSAIENRVLGWLACDDKILDVFRKNQDPYLAFAVYSTGRSYEDLWHEFKVLGKKKIRNDNKPPTLGCGYMLSAGKYVEDSKTGELIGTGLLGYAQNMGILLTPEAAKHAVSVFRDTFEDVVSYWYTIEKAMKKCILTGRPQEAEWVYFDMKGPFCRMNLPSGHALHYHTPRVENRKKPWGDIGPTIVYNGVNEKGAWGTLTTHPGKVTENAVQAIARDLLVHGMRLAKKEGLDIRMHIHDQVVSMGLKQRASHDLKVLSQCMSVVPKWAPGLLLGAEGMTSRIFVKD